MARMRPVSPREGLREQPEALGMSGGILAAPLHFPTNRITGILNATRALTLDRAAPRALLLGHDRMVLA